MQVSNPFNLVENAWSLKNLMTENKLIMVYSDHITPRTYEHLMNLAEEKLDHLNTSLKHKKKILHILVEALQNIATHGYRDHTNTVASLFVIGMESDNAFFVISGNTVTTKIEEYLREKLDHLNTLDNQELRAIYKDTIQHGEFTDKGGAGLGFIDIMRKSQSKLDYNFAPVNSSLSFFTYKVNIQGAETDNN
ncbi:MAG: SiaB family protein kinase [Bacteroidia bacterium]